MDPTWKWELCLGCGPFIRCPTCGANCGFSGEVDGKECPTCPAINAYWHQTHTDGTTYELSGFSREEVLKERAEARQQFIDNGGKFATLEDLESL